MSNHSGAEMVGASRQVQIAIRQLEGAIAFLRSARLLEQPVSHRDAIGDATADIMTALAELRPIVAPHPKVVNITTPNAHAALVAACLPLMADADQQDEFGGDEGCCENSHMVTIGHHMPGCPKIEAWSRLRAALKLANQQAK